MRSNLRESNYTKMTKPREIEETKPREIEETKPREINMFLCVITQ